MQVELAFSGGLGLKLGSGVHSHRQICLLKGLMCVFMPLCLYGCDWGGLWGHHTQTHQQRSASEAVCAADSAHTHATLPPQLHTVAAAQSVLLLHSAAAAAAAAHLVAV